MFFFVSSKGRYDSSLTFAQNVELTEPILSRFDILCVVRDLVDPIADSKLASFVINSHIKSHPHNTEEDMEEEQSQEELIPQDLLRKYIFYARTNCFPSIQTPYMQKISTVYSELRMHLADSSMNARHNEAMIRLCRAHAKMHLRNSVEEEDVDMAIHVMLHSVINAQKFSVANRLKKTFAKYFAKESDNHSFMYNLLLIVFRETELYANKKEASFSGIIHADDFETRARENGLSNFESFYKSPIFNTNYKYDSKNKLIRKRK